MTVRSNAATASRAKSYEDTAACRLRSTRRLRPRPPFQSREHPFGRVCAVYGAVFIVLSLLWRWAIDQGRPDMRDAVGAAIGIVGALIMTWPRSAPS